MQVFFNIINNAVDAMESHEGGVLTIKTMRDRGNVTVLFSDTDRASRILAASSIRFTPPSPWARAPVLA
jgi:signal transduction histidine kinase